MANVEAKDRGSIIREWLAEYKSLAESSIPSYAKEIFKKNDTLDAILHLFKSRKPNVTDSMNDLLQPVCHQLFEFYRSGFEDLKNFTINLFPSIILSHIVLSSSSSDSTSTDALLLSIYALENTSQEKEAESPGLEIPQLGHSSIYHDAMSGIFSEQMWSMQTPSRRFYQKPILSNHNAIIPANRFQILTQIMSIYCSHIAILKKLSHLSLCNACKFLGSSGYSWQTKYLEKNAMSMQPCKRYPLSVEFMLKMLRCVYFAMYNNCQNEAFLAAEAMQRRAKKELVPQVIFLCNAILNTAIVERDEEKFNEAQHGETAPYGLLSVNLTPILARESSRKGGRWAATAKSIKDHRWRHHNEEISGDLSRSLVSQELQTHPPKIVQQSSDLDEPVKSDKHSGTSPTKLLKSKLKKSAASGMLSEKSKSPAPSSGEEQKNRRSKKISTSTDEQDIEKVKRSPSQKKLSPTLSKKPSRTSIGIRKHPSMDEGTATNHKQQAFSSSKSSSDVDKYEVKILHSSATVDTGYTSGEGKHDTSATGLLDGFKLDTSSESEDVSVDKKSIRSRHLSSDDKSRESYPLLSASETMNTKSQTTAF